MESSNERAWIHKLKTDDYLNVEGLFKELDYNLQISSILKGRTKGVVYADDPNDPGSAFIWNEDFKFYLAGETDNPRFNEALNDLLTEEIYPRAKQRKIWGWVLHFHPDGWADKLGEILKGTRPMRDLRRYYTLDRVMIDWRSQIESGDEVSQVDRELLDRAHLDHIDDVTNEVRDTWGSVDAYLEHGFGFCLTHNGDIASWCLSEYNSEDRCEIGIETFEQYRRRRYAAITASAFLEHCVAENVAPGWHCWESNEPSWKLAERIGFGNPLTYPIYFDWFNERYSLLVNASWFLNKLGMPHEAADHFDQAFLMSDALDYHYYHAARAKATIGEDEKALDYLYKAVEKGWSNVKRLSSDDAFKNLHTEDRWKKLLSKLEGTHE